MQETITKYDSTADTTAHIDRVRDLLNVVGRRLLVRGWMHDKSKLKTPEKEMFDEATQRLRGLTYGSDEYKAALAELKPALDHHYANNPHHPEHWAKGVIDMSLLDIIEMLIDWKAASERHADGDIYKSIEINRERFGLSAQLASIFVNTAKELGW